MKSFFSALSFLTLIPVPQSWQGSGHKLEAGVWYYPAVGVVLGLLLAILYWGLNLVFPPGTGALLLVLAWALVTGGLHLDGAADTADGFFSSRPRDKILDIMRDSRLGTMGAAALWFILCLKWVSVWHLAPGLRYQAIVLIPVCGRVCMLIHMAWLPYARAQGLASAFVTSHLKTAAWAGGLFLVSALFIVFNSRGLLLVGVLFVFLLIFNAVCRKMIGGFTGDTIGAACELCETVALAALTTF